MRSTLIQKQAKNSSPAGKDLRASEWAVFRTCAGCMGVAFSPLGLSEVILPQPQTARIEEHFRTCQQVIPATDARLTDLQWRFQAYFCGQAVDFRDQLDLSGYTPFQQTVWQALRLILRGNTRSYQWVANTIGKPSAARAVGQAVGRNPLPVVVPCHRVIASDGSIGGFTGGLELKRNLLALEGIIF